jgi:hypothetical protein
MNHTPGTRTSPGTRAPIARSVVWTVALIAAAIVVPWVSFYLEPNDSSPWWTFWVPVGTWVLIALLGIAQMVRGRGARRWLGLAIILGDLIAFYLILGAIATATGGG